MKADNPRPWLPEHSLLLAQVSALCFGLGLTAWGLAPAVLERMITGKTPSLDMLWVNGLLFVLGGAYVMAHVLLRRRVRWAAWLVFALSVMLGGCGVAVLLGSGMRVGSTFLIVLSAQTAFASWLAIGAMADIDEQERIGFDWDPDSGAELDPESGPRKPRSNLLTHL